MIRHSNRFNLLLTTLCLLLLVFPSCRDDYREDLESQEGQSDIKKIEGTTSLSDIGLFVDDNILQRVIDKSDEFRGTTGDAFRSIRLKMDRKTMTNGEKRANVLVDRGHNIQSLKLRLVVCDPKTREEVGQAIVNFVPENHTTIAEDEKLVEIDPNTGREHTDGKKAEKILKPDSELFALTKNGQAVELTPGKQYWACFKLDFQGRNTQGQSSGKWDEAQTQYIASTIHTNDGFYIKASLQENGEEQTANSQIIDIPYVSKWHLITAQTTREDGNGKYKLAFKEGETVNLSPLGSILMVSISSEMQNKWLWLRGLELNGINMLGAIDNNVPKDIKDTKAVYPKMVAKQNRITPKKKIWLDEPICLRTGMIWHYVEVGGYDYNLHKLLDYTEGGYGIYMNDSSFTPDKRKTTLLVWVPSVSSQVNTSGVESNISVLYGKYGPWKRNFKLNFQEMPQRDKTWKFDSQQESPSGRAFYMDIVFSAEDEDAIERQLLPIDMIWHTNLVSEGNKGWGINDQWTYNGIHINGKSGQGFSGVERAFVSDVKENYTATIPFVNNRRGILNANDNHPNTNQATSWKNMHLPDLRDILSIMPISIMKPGGDIGIEDYGWNGKKEANTEHMHGTRLLTLSNDTWNDFAVGQFSTSVHHNWSSMYSKYRMFYNSHINNRICREPVRLPYFQYKGTLVQYPISGTDTPSGNARAIALRDTPPPILYEQEMERVSPPDLDDSMLKDSNGRYYRSKFMEKTVRSFYSQNNRKFEHGENYVGDSNGARVYGQRFVGTEWTSIWEYILPYGRNFLSDEMEIKVLYVGNEMDDEWYYRAKHPRWGGGKSVDDTYNKDGWTTDNYASHRKTYFNINSWIGGIDEFTDSSQNAGSTAPKFLDLDAVDVEDNPFNLGEIVQRFIKVSRNKINVVAQNITQKQCYPFPYLIRQGGFESDNRNSYYLWVVNPSYTHRNNEEREPIFSATNASTNSWAGLVQLRQFPNEHVNHTNTKGHVLPFFNLPTKRYWPYKIQH